MRGIGVVGFMLFLGCAPTEVGAPVFTGELRPPTPPPVVIKCDFGKELWGAILDVIPCENIAIIAYLQGMFESNAGTSYIYREGNNAFGIKYWGEGDHVAAVDDWNRVFKFKKYPSVYESVLDWYRLVTGPRYSLHCDMSISDMIVRLKERGYATDNLYVLKLNRMMKMYLNEDVYK